VVFRPILLGGHIGVINKIPMIYYVLACCHLVVVGVMETAASCNKKVMTFTYNIEVDINLIENYNVMHNFMSSCLTRKMSC